MSPIMAGSSRDPQHGGDRRGCHEPDKADDDDPAEEGQAPCLRPERKRETRATPAAASAAPDGDDQRSKPQRRDGPQGELRQDRFSNSSRTIVSIQAAVAIARPRPGRPSSPTRTAARRRVDQHRQDGRGDRRARVLPGVERPRQNGDQGMRGQADQEREQDGFGRGKGRSVELTRRRRARRRSRRGGRSQPP